MINKVKIFIGSKRDFNEKCKKFITSEQSVVPFLEVMQHYNASIRPNGYSVFNHENSDFIDADYCIVKADDYGSVLPFVLSNFCNTLTLNADIGCLILHNPPRQVIDNIKASISEEDISYDSSQYKSIDVLNLQNAFADLQANIIGQDIEKKKIISGLYKFIKEDNIKPAVYILYGPSGVGKTETAKCLSKSLGGNVLRIQFSMMQTQEAYNYIFGAEHTKQSFARDLLSRETNVILIDEFDKVNSVLYNAFYEVFDEGEYSDTNYDVNLHNSIFICTTNFRDEREIKDKLGMAMFSRITKCIEFSQLNDKQKLAIVDKDYIEIMNKLTESEKDVISKTEILDFFKRRISRYDNIRILKTKLEMAIYDALASEYIYHDNK